MKFVKVTLDGKEYYQLYEEGMEGEIVEGEIEQSDSKGGADVSHYTFDSNNLPLQRDTYLACRLLQAAYLRNIRIPDAFGVAGFGNTNVSNFSSPALTTVDESFFESGVISMRNIILSIGNKKFPEQTPITGKLIIRESTKNLPHNLKGKDEK